MRQSEERFRAIAEQFSDCIFVTDLVGTITYISPASDAIFGLPAAEMTGCHIEDFLPASSRAFALEMFERTAAPGGRIQHLEIEMKRHDGSTFIGELDGARFEIGDERGTLGVIRDITARKRAEQEIEESRTLLRTVIDLMPDPVYVTDSTGRKILSNPMDVEACGAADETEVLGRADADFYPPGEASLMETDDLCVLQEGETIANKEVQVTLADGRLRWWLVSKVPLRDAEGHIVGLVGVTHDFTAQKLAEQESERSRQLLRTVIDLLPDAIYVKDEAARKILVNRADVANTEARDEDEVLGKTDLELFTPDVAASFYADDLYVLQTGEALRDREETFVSPSGRQHKVLLTTKVPLRDDEGAIVGLVGIGHDITERTAAEQETERSRLLLRTVIDLLPDAVYAKDADAENSRQPRGSGQPGHQR